MKRDKKPSNYWTKERVFEEAKKYKSKYEFFKGCESAYQVARKNGWLSEMDWFVKGKRPDGYWQNKENVFAESKKYDTIKEFERANQTAVVSARKNGWIKEMTWLVDGRLKMLSDKNDSVYKYYWEETNSIYIGRTLMRRQKIRDKEHIFKEKDIVHIYSKENSFAVPPMEIIEENLTVKEGLEREDYWVNYYKEKGYNVLNTGKTGIGSGSLGAISYGKWPKERVIEESKKYTTRKEFVRGCRGAYNVAYRNGWLKEMPWLKLQRKRNVQVLQLDKNTKEIIAEFSNIAELKKQFGYSEGLISQCCNGKRKSAYGYIWKYKEESVA